MHMSPEQTPPLRHNRSVPSSTVMPVLGYEDVAAAVEWLTKAFGCSARLRIGNHRCQMSLGGGHFVVAEAPPNAAGDAARRDSVLVRVTDADAHCAAARRAGARIVSEPADQPYGERQYSAEDPGGHRWTFSQTIADVDPAVWGGVLTE
jgi:uncharacterized glyoxalase superfamily protein PhnB